MLPGESAKLYETFHSLYKSELTLSMFYRQCANTWDKDKVFWLRLSGEEVIHSRNLVKVAKIISSAPEKVETGIEFDPVTIKDFINTVKENALKVREGKLSRMEALEVAREFENNIIELGYTGIILTQDTEANYLLKKMDLDTYKHKSQVEGRILDFQKVLKDKELAQKNQMESRTIRLKEENSFLEAVLTSIADAVYFADRDGTIRYWNLAAEKLTGYRSDEVIGSRCCDLLKHTDESGNVLCNSFCPLKKSLEEGSSSLVNVWLTTSEGTKKPVEVSCSRVTDSQGEFLGVVEIFRDRSRQKEMEKLRDEFFATITHDLKAPLASMLGFADLAADPQYGEISDKKIRFLGNIKRSGEMLTNLINNIVDASRLESGEMKYNFRDVSLDELLEYVKITFEPLAQRNQVKLDFNFPGQVMVKVDPERLRRVFNNLLINALRFTSRQGTIGIRAHIKDDRLQVEVFDTGKGIPAEDLKSLFGKYKQARGESAGSGLGLFIVKNLLEGHGSQVRVESKVDQGTSFFFELPLSENQPPSQEPTVVQPETITQPDSIPDPKIPEIEEDDTDDDVEEMTAGHLLIAGPVGGNRELVKTALEDMGHKVETASSGMEALSMLSAINLDGVILMPPLPDISVEDFYQSMEFDQELKKKPLSVISTVCRAHWKKLCSNFIPLPLNKKILRKTMRKMLRNRQAPSVKAYQDAP